MSIADLVPIEGSANLESAAYDEENNEIYVLFKSGGMGKYHGVPRELYNDLFGAQDVRRAAFKRIKEHFTYEHFTYVAVKEI